ncbi:type I polyketide synthase [Streptomyces sp. NBC_00893]|uniref:type I polyketide synthase n=1 Tax=Streptomyces sp. NBC_00893 TaxID=2975862 RepID=UPI00224D0647|nr:type I polyketide synthase [Streptomyces sp. NBC_00893]MCX4849520.1 acyltransferase domain-containing protein [Streptomyces sp. NBC_00893]
MSTDTGTEGDSVDAPDIAVIAMEGRFPGAPTLREFWELLKSGKEAIRPVGDQAFIEAGGAPDRLADPNLVRVECTLDDTDLFDAEFFGFQPAEAELLDPQQRVFLECAYHAFEQAGYVPGEYDGAVGVYAGASQSQYYLDNIYPMYARRPGTVDSFIGSVANASSALVTRVSYLLNLTGPSFAVQTACSTSLVAVHTACQDLLDYRCDLALAGGASVNPSAKLGYQYVPDGPFSPDGSCRPYSASGAGMSPGDGVGVVLLKRLEDALADGDEIRAVIKGSAVNNDGSRKVGFTAPSVKGQRDVIVAAHAIAGVTADAIGYVEGHGTATPVGDPIEVSALTKAFAASTDKLGYCVLGSVKSNLGHLDAAAGIAGLIKTVLALENEAIPPTVHFDEPNQLIDFAGSPFLVSGELRPWERSTVPRLAGVSSFGVGGTNAHVVVEEAPLRPTREPEGHPEVVLLSAATPKALSDMGKELAEHVSRGPEPHIGDLAHTLQTGRRPMHQRRAVVAERPQELAEALRGGDGVQGETGGRPRDVVFMYPGGGSQYQRMGQQLYEKYPVFRREMDRCARIVESACGVDLLAALYPPGDARPSRENIDVPVCRLPAIAATEWSVTALLASWGVRPTAVVGNSLGEYTAACVAGVMDLEDMLPLVAERERLIEKGGGMALSVLLDGDDVESYLLPGTSLAAVNAPGMCTVSGTHEAIMELEKHLTEQGVDQHRLRVPGAVHSVALDPVLDELRAAVKKVTLREPAIPIVTNLTGDWLTAEMACDPEHWVQHTRGTVRFRDCLRTLAADHPPALLEAGPSGGLVKLAEYTLGTSTPAVTAIRHAYGEQSDPRVLLNAVARLWTTGVEVDWAAAREGRPGRTVPLPGYPFQRKRFWVERTVVRPDDPEQPGRSADSLLTARVWSGSGLPEPRPGRVLAPARTSVLMVVGDAEHGTPPAGLRAEGERVIRVRFTDGFGNPAPDHYELDPMAPADVHALCAHVWGDGDHDAEVRLLDLTFTSAPADPLRAVTASAVFAESLLGTLGGAERRLRAVVVSSGAFDLGSTEVQPERRFTQGLLSQWRHEGARVDATYVETEGPLPSGGLDNTTWRALLHELHRPGAGETVARRGGHRWTAGSVPVEPTADDLSALPNHWIVPDGHLLPARRYVSFLSAAFDGEATVVESVGEPGPAAAGDESPGLLRLLGHAPDGEPAAAPEATLAWLRDLWQRRAEQPFGAVVLVDLLAERPSAEQAAVSAFAEACVETAAADGLPWRLLRWRKGAEWTDEALPVDGGAELGARGRLGADALAAALRAPGHPVLTVASGSRVATVGRHGGAAGHETEGEAAAEPSGEQDGRARPPLSTPYVAPRNDLERRVAAIWRKSLGIDAIGADDNFFELGGESLLLMRVVASLREQFTVNMSIRQLYVNDRLTISGIATVLEEKEA